MNSGKTRTSAPSTLEAFEQESSRKRRLLRQEQFLLHVAEELIAVLEREGVSRAELAKRLGTTKGFVSQVLAGDKNLTLRTVSDFCDALGYKSELNFRCDFSAQRSLAQSFFLERKPHPVFRVHFEVMKEPDDSDPGDEAIGVA